VISALIRSGCIVASVAAIAAGAHVVRSPSKLPSMRSARAAHTQDAGVPAAWPDSAMRHAVAAAPFRLRRVLTSVRYDPVKAAAPAAPAVPRTPRPVLVLSGILWSGTPVAAIEGIPGADGSRLLSKGDTIAGLRIRRISRTDVVVTGFDTTWVLTIREVWR
jgi:hypothetical protein